MMGIYSKTSTHISGLMSLSLGVKHAGCYLMATLDDELTNRIYLDIKPGTEKSASEGKTRVH